ncbi:hypothetical protein C8R44DRAFT_618464 [Mycena epipterygia]|nr:hypothetical protein C8R44DRAFT_618464 [Mycena epipterygia]
MQAHLSGLNAVTSTPQTGRSLTRDAPTLAYGGSHWIWSTEIAGGVASVGTRAFRKTFTTPAGKTPVLADIIMNGDDDFKLWVNGEEVGGASSWPATQRFCVTLRPCSNLFAATAHTATVNVAGLLSTIQITYSDNTTSTIVTDASWRVNTEVTPGFERPNFDDSSWETAYAFKQYPAGEWGGFYHPAVGEKVECKNLPSTPCPCQM